MLKNHLTIAIRNFWRNKGFFAINVMGLALGIAAFLFIVAYVNFEFSYDTFHERADHLYRVSVDFYKNGVYEVSDAECYNLAGETMKQEFEEVKDYANIRGLFTFSISHEDKIIKEDRVLYAEPNFLKLFTFPVIHGNIDEALVHPYSIVLTQSSAKKIFGTDDAIGKRLMLNGQHAVTVTAVIQDVPPNSHIHFDYLMSYSTARAIYPNSNYEPNWNGNNGFTYVLLQEGADAKALQEKLHAFSKKHLADREERLILQPVKDIHLYSNKTFEAEPNRNGTAIKVLLGVGFLILGIAWINYINLATARSVERAKEVGIRKTLGSQKTELIRQFMLESLLVNTLALLLAVFIIDIALPLVLRIAGAEALSWKFSADLWIGGILFFILGSVASGFYPAWVLSSYKPSVILKGKFNSSPRGVLLRKGMVVVQFMASFVLIAGTLTIHQQLVFMTNKDLGMNLEKVLVLPAPGNIADTTLRARVHTFTHNVEALPFVKSVGISETLPGHGTTELNSSSGNINRYNATERQAPIYYYYTINETFFSTLQIEVIAGNNFSNNAELNRDKIVINEEALQKLGFDSPEEAVGTKLYWGDYRPEVIGVIKNYNHLSLDNNHIPILFFYSDYAGDYYTLRLESNAADLPQSIKAIRRVWKEAFADSVFEYSFLDERFNAQYISDRQFSQLFTVFAVLAVFIACLGLLGLSAYAVVKRTKEIGIRKVLGASTPQIIQTLTIDFLKLIIVAIIVSSVCAGWGIKAWLNSYAFRIEFNGLMLLIPAAVLLCIAVLTIGYHTVRAASANPAESLKTE